MRTSLQCMRMDVVYVTYSVDISWTERERKELKVVREIERTNGLSVGVVERRVTRGYPCEKGDSVGFE